MLNPPAGKCVTDYDFGGDPDVFVDIVTAADHYFFSGRAVTSTEEKEKRDEGSKFTGLVRVAEVL